jgi:hypothetical protein
LRKTYEIHNKLLKVLLKENLILIIGMIIFIPILNYFRSGSEIELNLTSVLIFSGSLFVFNIPAIILLIEYYFENKNTTLEIDSEFVKINRNGQTIKHKISEIEVSTYNIGIYYKNAIDNSARWSTIHSDFGYWDVKFKNGERYYLSNLLVDFLHQEAFVENTKYRFRLFPYIDKSKSKKAIELKQDQEKSRIEKFIDQYQSKNEKQLREILDNKKSYQNEAVKAAEIVLKNKNVG